ncbi:MAG: GTPase HflX, partial [Micrococcales bacterium]|nr:GTPase HflX [Micrococcales bacterium]
RRIRTRMAKLRRETAAMAPARATKRRSRERHSVPSVAIVGYTNAGKSSLLNQLTGAGVLVDNALFATLDPTVRRATTPDGRVYTLTDTVGFVRALPHQLVEAFRSTLEEVADADLVVHVVDAAHSDPEGQIAAVRTVLADIEGALDIPEIVVLNKADLADGEAIARLRTNQPGAVVVSARTGQGLDELGDVIAEALPRPDVLVDVVVPYDRGDLVHQVHERGEVESSEHRPEGTALRARVDPALAQQLHDAAR